VEVKSGPATDGKALPHSAALTVLVKIVKQGWLGSLGAKTNPSQPIVVIAVFELIRAIQALSQEGRLSKVNVGKVKLRKARCRAEKPFHQIVRLASSPVPRPVFLRRFHRALFQITPIQAHPGF